MRAIFTVAALLVVLAIVGVLAKKQLSAGVAPTSAGSAQGAAAPAAPRQQVQQFRNQVEGAMQQARPMPDDPQ